MRGVAKGPPPTDVAPSGHKSCSLIHAEKLYLADLTSAPNPSNYARSHFNDLNKHKLRELLYNEQRFLCVYCETPVKERHPPPPIDHWQPLSVFPEHALSWKNLYLSCSSAETCDGAKKNRALRCDHSDEQLPWPSERQYEDLIGFSSSGEAYVRQDAGINGRMREALELAIADRIVNGTMYRSLLNLNHLRLIEARAAAIDSEIERFEKKFAGRTASQDEREQIATSLLGDNPRASYVSIRVAFLRRQLGKGK